MLDTKNNPISNNDNGKETKLNIQNTKMQNEYSTDYNKSIDQTLSSKEESELNLQMNPSEKSDSSKVGSFQTITAIANSLIGGVCLTLPTNFIKGGIVLSLICIFLFAFVMERTVQFIIRYQKPGETDLVQVMTRILGKRFSNIFTLLSSLEVFIAAIIYFQLMNRTLYAVITYIFYLCGYTSYADPDSSKLTFDQYSMQWQCLVLSIPVFAMFCKKDIKIFIKLGRIGIVALISYGMFLIYLFGNNVATGALHKQIHEGNVKLFTNNFSLIVGNLALAFFCHNYILPITSNNKNMRNNSRDLKFGFLLGMCIYLSIGCLGGLGVVGRQKTPNPRTISDYFSANDLFSTLIQLVYFTHLFTVNPIWNNVSRNQFYSVILNNKQETPTQFYVFNLATILACTIIQLFNINVNIIISLNSTLIASCFVYIVPFALRKKEYKIRENKFSSQPLLDNNGVELDSQIESKENCIYNKTKMPIYELALWILCSVFGLSVASFQVYSIVTGKE